MPDIKKPNADQSDDGNMTSILASFIKNILMEVDDMMPAKVISYDDVNNRAVVQPMMMIVGTDGSKTSRPQYANIPVYRFGGGGFFMRFPIKPGDVGWIKANDRDISLFFQRGCEEDQPNTDRVKNFGDAMFFPDSMKAWIIDGKNMDAVVLQSLDGNVCLSLHADKAILDTPRFEVNSDEIEMNAELTTINSDVIVNGDHAVMGSSSSEGGAMTHNGVDVGSTHTHGGVQSGSSNTGTPT